MSTTAEQIADLVAAHHGASAALQALLAGLDVTASEGEAGVARMATLAEALAGAAGPVFIPASLYVSTRGFRNILAWTVPGTVSWVVPATCRVIWGRVWGAGGGGGGSNSNGAGMGGAGGGYGEGIYAVTPGTNLEVRVGAGGNGGLGSGPSNGTAGGSSWIGGLLSATGGGAGRSNVNVGGANNPAAGGTATGGLVHVPGQPGGYPATIGSQYFCGFGGGAFATGPAAALVDNGGIGAQYPGGGAGGGAKTGSGSQDGASGANGLVIIVF